MTDRSWMLSAAAIASAKKCIQAVDAELGIKLKLSHPDFLSLMGEYAELTGSNEITEAYLELASYAGIKPQQLSKAEVVTLKPSTTTAAQNPDDFVEYQGKQYPRFDEHGSEFKGLYRGQAMYD